MDYTKQFQTPPEVCRYMVSLLPESVVTVLEPTPGIGNIIDALSTRPNLDITAPDDYFLLSKSRRFDAVIGNPPFSSKSAFMDNAPDSWKSEKGMKFGYRLLIECMQKADIVIALMPWFTISDSDVRLRFIKSYGLKSVTALPRKTFQYARIQTVVLELRKGFTGATEFEVFDFLEPIPDERLKGQVKMDMEVRTAAPQITMF